MFKPSQHSTHRGTCKVEPTAAVHALRWADLVDSDTESNAESDAAAALPQPCEHSLPEADGQDWNTQPGQEGRCMPFLVLLGAYVRGLLQVRGSHDSMVWLQRTLQQDARARCLRRFLVPDLVFWISFDPAVVRGHVAEFAAAVRNRVASPCTLRLWQFLLQLECQRCPPRSAWDAFLVWRLQL